ncbi:interferon gamma [Epinephelus lanceolatus]
MSSCCGSLCLLILLGVALASGIPCQFAGNLKDTPDSIVDVLNLKQAEIGSNPLFSSVIKSINTSCQRKVHLMNVTLDVYTRIFTSILQHNQHQDKTRTPLLDQLSDQESSQVVSVVTELQKNMEKLKRRLSHVSHEREDLLSKLNRIDVDDPMVQRKALAQFKEVYQAASVIGYPSCGHAHASSAERR